MSYAESELQHTEDYFKAVDELYSSLQRGKEPALVQPDGWQSDGQIGVPGAKL